MSNQSRVTVAGLTLLLGLGLLVAGLGVGALLLWLLGPVLTVLVAAVGGAVYMGMRAAHRGSGSRP